MKILLINGSPREGNTARVLEALAVRLGGHELETLRLGELGIRGCIGCLSCQQDVEHFVCHQTGDDANAVLAKIVAADVVLMATPLYGHCFTAQMKCLDDRMSALVKWVGGEHPHVVSALKDKPMTCSSRSLTKLPKAVRPACSASTSSNSVRAILRASRPTRRSSRAWRPMSRRLAESCKYPLVFGGTRCASCYNALLSRLRSACRRPQLRKPTVQGHRHDLSPALPEVQLRVRVRGCRPSRLP